MRKVLVLLLLGSSAIGAQAPLRYRYVTTSPNMSSTFDGGATSRMISVNKAVAVVSLAVRDSLGQKLYEMVVDSSIYTLELTDSTAEAKARFDQMMSTRPAPPTPPPTTARPVVRHQVLVQNGVPTASLTVQATGTLRPDTLDSHNAYLSMLGRKYGLGLLVPGPNFPTTVGAVRADTFFSHTISTPQMTMGGAPLNIPPITLDDSTIVIWKRVSTDTLEGQLTRHTGRSSESTIGSSQTTGLYRIVYDAKHEVREATFRYTSSSVSAPTSGARPPTTSTSASSWSLVRIP